MSKDRRCKCGGKLYDSHGGDDVQCERCGRWYNAWGQEVRFPIYDSPIAPQGFDPMDAGESWDDD
jgi:hypothetical protein